MELPEEIISALQQIIPLDLPGLCIAILRVRNRMIMPGVNKNRRPNRTTLIDFNEELILLELDL
ncbi:4327_t:CDS:2 [Funneliformis geosporum]|uniref:4327_t:CDS:1 n=1 Tax=Funneliformis geosporum TaxID=1117311 RepID=A0A9W4SIR5_9GLOM|nr:4327_t:CDS:2 [Funneliformis geosporum]